jgi:hypothetical protein
MSDITVSVSGGTAEVTVTQVGGDRGPTGATGPANSLTIGTVTTGAPGSTAVAVITGTAPNQVISFTIPRGDVGQQGAQGTVGSVGETGPSGPPNSLTIGSVVTLAAGSSAVATITGTSPNQVLSLSIPRGDTGVGGPSGATGPAGPANSISIGTVTTGVTASATITGTAPSQVLNLVLPKGDKGDTGAQGLTGSVGPVGPANTLSIGTVITGVTASATITGTAPSQTLSLVLPRGDKGDTGATGSFGSPQEINTVTANYTLVIGDAGKLIAVNSSASATITVPADSSVAFDRGTHIDFARIGAGAVSFVAASGATVNATPGLILRARYSAASIVKITANSWILVGDTA